MPDLMYTFIYDMPGHGFTETHWRQTTSQEGFTQSVTIGVELARRRQVMSGKETIFQAVRVSNGELEGRGGHTEQIAILGNQSHGSAASNVALNVRIGTAENVQEKTTQWRGFWDSEEVTGGAVLRSPAFMNAFNSWAQYFAANNFGWRGIFGKQTFPVQGYTVTDQGVVTVTLSGVIGGAMPLNRYKEVRFTGVNGGRSQLNGEQVAMYVGSGPTANTSTVLLKFPKALLPFSGIGLMEVAAYTFRDASTITLGRLGKRQAGAPLLRSRGRSAKRIRI